MKATTQPNPSPERERPGHEAFDPILSRRQLLKGSAGLAALTLAGQLLPAVAHAFPGVPPSSLPPNTLCPELATQNGDWLLRVGYNVAVPVQPAYLEIFEVSADADPQVVLEDITLTPTGQVEVDVGWWGLHEGATFVAMIVDENGVYLPEVPYVLVDTPSPVLLSYQIG